MPEQKKNKILFVIIIVAIIIIGTTLTIEKINANKIYYGVNVAQINLSGKTPEEAKTIIEKQWNNFANQPIEFVYQPTDMSQRIICCNNSSKSIVGFGFEIDYQKTIDQAYNIGKDANFISNFKNKISSLLNKHHLDIIYTFNIEKFNNQTNKSFTDIEHPARNATLVFDENNSQFIIQPSVDGTIVNRDKLITDLENNIKLFTNNPIELIVIFDPPLVHDNNIDFAQQKAQQIIDAQPFKLTSENKTWTVKESVLANWIKFNPTPEVNSKSYTLSIDLDKDKIKEYLSEIASELDQPTLNAELQIEDNHATVFTLPQYGYGLYVDDTLTLLEKGILSDPPINKIDMIVGKTYPTVNLSETNDLGINVLLGQGTSNFGGSPANRTHNIKIGTEKFKGVILEPNEEFSFLDLLGSSGPENGFLEELVIKEGGLVKEYGGGLCQVSTTLFRAAVNSGLKITRRKAHAFPITYYNPQGFDATIYEPWTDFRFLNDTDNHILIYPTIYGTQLTFYFYGNSGGRQTKITGPTILEKKENGSMNTLLIQEIRDKDGVLVRTENFTSYYDSPDSYTKVEE